MTMKNFTMKITDVNDTWSVVLREIDTDPTDSVNILLYICFYSQSLRWWSEVVTMKNFTMKITDVNDTWSVVLREIDADPTDSVNILLYICICLQSLRWWSEVVTMKNFTMKINDVNDTWSVVLREIDTDPTDSVNILLYICFYSQSLRWWSEVVTMKNFTMKITDVNDTWSVVLREIDADPTDSVNILLYICICLQSLRWWSEVVTMKNFTMKITDVNDTWSVVLREIDADPTDSVNIRIVENELAASTGKWLVLW